MNTIVSHAQTGSELQLVSSNLVNSQQLNLLQRLERFTAPYLEEKLIADKKFKSRKEYQSAFIEFKKFVFLTQISNTKLGMCSKEVDEVWHQFILFTPQYHRFCTDYLSGYLHHLPRTSFTPLVSDGVKSLKALYTEFFGELPSIWNYSEECSDPGEGSPSGWCGPDPNG